MDDHENSQPEILLLKNQLQQSCNKIENLTTAIASAFHGILGRGLNLSLENARRNDPAPPRYQKREEGIRYDPCRNPGEADIYGIVASFGTFESGELNNTNKKAYSHAHYKTTLGREDNIYGIEASFGASESEELHNPGKKAYSDAHILKMVAIEKGGGTDQVTSNSDQSQPAALPRNVANKSEETRQLKELLSQKEKEIQLLKHQLQRSNARIDNLIDAIELAFRNILGGGLKLNLDKAHTNDPAGYQPQQQRGVDYNLPRNPVEEDIYGAKVSFVDFELGESSVPLKKAHYKNIVGVEEYEVSARATSNVDQWQFYPLDRYPMSHKTPSILKYKTANIRDLYSIGRNLGQGKFGTTHLCTDISTGCEYACKSISKRKMKSSKDVEDVRREIQIMHHLSDNNNVVSIKGAFEDRLYVHIVMEVGSGGELFQSIIQKGHYSEKEAAEIFKSIVEIVESCHSLGVMHRDLKPENLLFVSKDDNVSLKAIDFGLSVYFKPGQIFTEVVGSPYYVAPEVLLKYYGPEADVWTAGVILYVLLSGVPPFWAETRKGIFDAILGGHIDFESEPWPRISNEAKDLVRKMLCRQPSERLTAHEVLCHPWICRGGVPPNSALEPAVLSRLKHFSRMNKLKKMALRVIAESISEDEIAGLTEMFKSMDTDNSGSITFDELKAGLRRYGSTMRDAEMRDLMNAVDVDNSGNIDFGEFLGATVHLSKLEREENLISVFSYFDKDCSGYITIDDLKQACIEHGMDDDHLEDVIREVDHDNDGKIDYAEFVRMMVNSDSRRLDMRDSLTMSMRE